MDEKKIRKQILISIDIIKFLKNVECMFVCSYSLTNGYKQLWIVVVSMFSRVMDKQTIHPFIYLIIIIYSTFGLSF